jgi:hypothetical protein
MNAIHRLCFVLGLTVAAGNAAAHHSPAMFDMTKDVTFEGTVTELSWRNPHIYFGVEIVGPDGKPLVQEIEAGPASNLVPLGMSADSIRPGDHVVVQAKPNRGGTGRTALGWVLTTADGVDIPLHVRAAAALAASRNASSSSSGASAASIAGVWVPQAAGFSTLAQAAREWPLTAAGKAAVEATREARIAARSECMPFGPPALMVLPATTTIEVHDTVVDFKLDHMGVERVVHLDQASHPAGLEPSVLGHSIGHWEGRTLVVDTTGYAAHPDGYAFDLPSSASKHVVERFALSADGKHIEYRATVEDPEYLAGSVSHRALWDYRPEQKPSGLPCDRDSAGRFATQE